MTLTTTFVGRATYSTFTGHRGDSLNAYLVRTMTFGDQPMNKSVFYPFQTGLVPIQRPVTN